MKNYNSRRMNEIDTPLYTAVFHALSSAKACDNGMIALWRLFGAKVEVVGEYENDITSENIIDIFSRDIVAYRLMSTLSAMEEAFKKVELYTKSISNQNLKKSKIFDLNESKYMIVVVPRKSLAKVEVYITLKN